MGRLMSIIPSVLDSFDRFISSGRDRNPVKPYGGEHSWQNRDIPGRKVNITSFTPFGRNRQERAINREEYHRYSQQNRRKDRYSWSQP